MGRTFGSAVWGRIAAVTALWATGAVIAAAPPPGNPGDEAPSAPLLSFGPIKGLTTGWHRAPAALPAPADQPVHFVAAKPAGGDVTWENALEYFESNDISLAVALDPTLKQLLVRATLTSDEGSSASAECTVTWHDTNVEDIEVTPAQLSVAALPPDMTNEQTVAAYYGDSIAELGTAADGSRVTSVGNDISATVTVVPGEFAPVVEWRVDGVGVALGASVTLRFDDPGRRSIEVGRPGVLDPVELTAYRVVMSEPPPGGDLPDQGPIIGAAYTVPGGFEDRITWLAMTRYGDTSVQTGRGPAFTSDFSNVYGPPLDPYGEIGLWGLKADNATRGRREELVACQSVLTLGFRDAAGRSMFDPSPNGWNEPFPIIVGGPGSNDVPCPFAGPTGGEIQIQKYRVGGETLEEVGENIFGASGAGPMLGGRHFAGSATLSYEVVWRSAGRDAQGNICVEVAEITWVTIIRLPDWDAPEGASPEARAEFARFRQCVETHERGHAGIYNTGMPAVRSAFVGVQPPRKFCVPGQKRFPRFNADGTPATPADAAIAGAINGVLTAAIDASPGMQGINQQGANYDAPRSAGNPTGTDHGRTQGAVLNTGIQ